MELEAWWEWCQRIPGYEEASRNRKKKLKRKYKMKGLTMSQAKMDYAEIVRYIKSPPTFDSVQCIPTCVGFGTTAACAANKKKEEDMYVSQEINEKTDLTRQTEYFVNRVHKIESDQTEVLLEKFGMNDREQPKTLEEFIRRIKKDEFTLHEDYDLESSPRYLDLTCGHILKWTHKVKKDKDGYKKARAKLDAKTQETRDLVMAWTNKDVEKVLAALKDFESTTFH